VRQPADGWLAGLASFWTAKEPTDWEYLLSSAVKVVAARLAYRAAAGALAA